jgi:hypothetical protein
MTIIMFFTLISVNTFLSYYVRHELRKELIGKWDISKGNKITILSFKFLNWTANPYHPLCGLNLNVFANFNSVVWQALLVRVTMVLLLSFIAFLFPVTLYQYATQILIDW